MKEVVRYLFDIVSLPLRLIALVVSAPLHFIMWLLTKTWFVAIPFFYIGFGFFFCGFAYLDELSDFTIPLYLKGLGWYFTGGTFKATMAFFYSTFFNKWWKIPLYFLCSFTFCYYLPSSYLELDCSGSLYDFGTTGLLIIRNLFYDSKVAVIRMFHKLFHTELPVYCMTSEEFGQSVANRRSKVRLSLDTNPATVTDVKKQQTMLKEDFELLSDSDFFSKYLASKEQVKSWREPLSVFDPKRYRRLEKMRQANQEVFDETPSTETQRSSSSHVLTKAKDRVELIEQIKSWTDDEFTGFYHMTKKQALDRIKASIQKQQGR